MIRSSKSPVSSGLLNIAILVVVVAVLYLARDLLIPLALAVTVSLILTPAVAWLVKFGMGRVPAALLVMVIALAGAGAVGWVIFTDLVDVANQLPEYRENIHKKLEAIRAPSTGAVGRAAASVKELGKELATPAAPAAPAAPPPPGDRAGRRAVPNPATHPVPVQVIETPENDLLYVRDMVQPFLRPLGVFGMVLIFSLFLMIGHHDLRDRLFRLVGVGQLNVMTLALDDATRRVSKYLLLQLLVNAAFGMLCGTGLFLIGVPFAVLWGAVAAILRIVPYVGSVVAAALPLILSLAVFDDWLRPLLVFLLFGTLELVTGNWVEPRLYGTHTGVSALALILTTVFWTVLWGPAGLILSTPLTVCVVVLGRYVPQFAFLHILLGDEPALVEEAQLYQRLLAMDDQEARAVIDRYLIDHSLLQLCDSVFIPALTLAEHDRHKGALDADREQFLFLSIREILSELPEKAGQPELADVEGAADTKPALPVGRVLCIPSSDEADEVTAAMLALLLEHSGCIVLPFTPDPGLQQLAFVQPAANDVFCISALPPFAFAHARTLSHQLRVRFPGIRIVVGVWGFAGETDRAMERFQAPRPDKLVTSLADAIQAVLNPTTTASTSRSPSALPGQHRSEA
jgi:predicted PurR-regulated permease PerM